MGDVNARYHKDILVPLSFGHIELMTDEIWEEYVNWCETDEAKPYLNEIAEVKE